MLGRFRGSAPWSWRFVTALSRGSKRGCTITNPKSNAAWSDGKKMEVMLLPKAHAYGYCQCRRSAMLTPTMPSGACWSRCLPGVCCASMTSSGRSQDLNLAVRTRRTSCCLSPPMARCCGTMAWRIGHTQDGARSRQRYYPRPQDGGGSIQPVAPWKQSEVRSAPRSSSKPRGRSSKPYDMPKSGFQRTSSEYSASRLRQMESASRRFLPVRGSRRSASGTLN